MMSEYTDYVFNSVTPDGKITKITKRIYKKDLVYEATVTGSNHIPRKVKRRLGIGKILTPTEFPNKKAKKEKKEKPPKPDEKPPKPPK